MMADPAAAAHEHHRHVRDVDHRHPVMAGAAREFEDAIALARDGIRHLPSEPGRAGHGAIVVGDIDLQQQLSTPGDSFDLADDVGHRKLAVGVRGGADIDRERHLAWNDIGRAGHRMDVPDSPDQPTFVGPAERLDRDDAFRGTRQRIAPQQHRHGAGMPGHAGETCREPRRARYRGHNPDRQAFAFKHRSLLDMQFDIAVQLASGPRCDNASRIEIPWRSLAPSTLSSKVPATARLPSKVDANRTPSSSAKPMTSMAKGNLCPRLCMAPTQEIAVTSPSGPSHLPASCTVS